MGEIIYDVVLNVKYAGCRQQLNVTTGEVNARKLRIKLTNGAVPIKLNQYTDTAIMRGVKSDKKLIYNTAKITEEGNVEYTLGSQDTVSGKTWYEVQVLRKDGDVEPKIIYSAQFKVEVNNKLYDDGSVTSTNQFGVLEDTIETARSWMNEKDADIDSRTLTCIEKFGYTEDDNTTPNTRKDPSNENSGIIFTAPKIPVDFDYIKAEQIDTDQYALRIQVFKDDEKINTVTVAGQQNVQIVDVRGATYIQIEVIGMPPDVDGKPEHFRLEKLKLFSGALGDVVEKVNKLEDESSDVKVLDCRTMGYVNGTLSSNDGSEKNSNYYVRSIRLSYDNDCYYTIECPKGKCVYCFVYDENNKYVGYSKKQEGTYVCKVASGYHVRFLMKYTNNTSSSGTTITDIDDFLEDYVVTRTERELEIETEENIYFYVDGDDGSRVPCVLRLPSTYKSSGKATQLVMCAHGAGGTVVPATDTNQLETWMGYVDSGYAIFDIHGASATVSKHWGNEAAVHAYYKAYRYIVENYNIDETMIISGKSMGGLTAINFASYYPNVCRCIAVLYPVTDLYNQININKEMIGNGNTSSMLKAYGITSWTDENTLPEKMIGFNPLHSRVVAANKILLNIPIKIWHGNADTYVDCNKTVDFVTKIKNAGGHAECVLKDGIYHGNYDKNKTPLSESNATGFIYENYWKTEVVEKELIPWIDNFKGTRNKTIYVKGSGKQSDNHWKGKKWYAYGTSLTDISNVGQYCKTVRNLSNLILTNKGISGGGICANTLIKDAIMNTTDGKTNADLITLEVGANDTSSALGTIYDTGNDTFCGALNQCIRYLQKNTNAQIVVISSTNSRYKSGDKTVEFTPDKTFGDDNHTKYDQWKATKEVCAINSVPYIGMGEEAGLGYARMIASDQYNIDNIHHTVCGGRNLGEFVWSKLKDIPLWSSEEVVAVPITITTQPQSVDSAVGNVVSFMVEAQGDGLTYQWQLSNDGGTTWGNTSVNGNTTKFISFAIPGANYSGRMFRCVITDANGNTLASNPAKLTLNGVHDVTITSQPQDISAKVGDTINISVVAKSIKSNKLTYQWQVSSTGETWKNTTVTGYNTSALNFAIPGANYNGRQYRCLVTDGNGSWALSDAMKLTVTS